MSASRATGLSVAVALFAWASCEIVTVFTTPLIFTSSVIEGTEFGESGSSKRPDAGSGTVVERRTAFPTPAPALSSVSTVVPSSVENVSSSFTAVVPVLIASPNVPWNVTPGTFSETVPPSLPAIEAGTAGFPPLAGFAGSSRKKPLPPVSVTMSVVPSPIARRTLSSLMRVCFVCAFVAGSVLVMVSNAKSPLSV